MHKWLIEIGLKNGAEFTVLYEGVEDSSIDVAAKLFFGKGQDAILDFKSADLKQHIFVVAGEIAAFGISTKRH